MENEAENGGEKPSTKEVTEFDKEEKGQMEVLNADEEKDNNIKQSEDNKEDIINNNNEDDSPLSINKDNNNKDSSPLNIITCNASDEKKEEVVNSHKQKATENIDRDEEKEDCIINNNEEREGNDSALSLCSNEVNIEMRNAGEKIQQLIDNIEQPKEEIKEKPIEGQIAHSKEEIIDYLTGEYKHSNADMNDISFEKWVSKDKNIQALCKEIEIPLRMKFNKLLDSHDLDCEFKLLKWITQDKLHRNKLISLPKELSYLNRYPYIIPYEFNQIFCSSSSHINQYINASSIDGPFESDRKLFIATQNPLNSTVEHFLQLILFQKVKVIIMLSSEYEESRFKGESYLPSVLGKPKLIGNYSIDLIEEPMEIIAKGLFLRKIRITHNETQAQTLVDHLQVTCWDEHSIPKQEIEKIVFQSLFNYVNECNPTKPCLVHCIDGIGRTGTFISLYNISKCINEQKKLNFEVPVINVFNVVRCLREQRIGMVTQPNLYRYIYKMALEFNKTFYDEE